MVTRRPRAFSRLPRLLAVSHLPSEEATPPVTNTCLVWLTDCAKGLSRGVHAGRPAGLGPRSTGIHGNTDPPTARPPRRGTPGRTQPEEVGGNGASAPAAVPYCPLRPAPCWASAKTAATCPTGRSA